MYISDTVGLSAINVDFYKEVCRSKAGFTAGFLDRSEIGRFWLFEGVFALFTEEILDNSIIFFGGRYCLPVLDVVNTRVERGMAKSRFFKAHHQALLSLRPFREKNESRESGEKRAPIKINFFSSGWPSFHSLFAASLVHMWL